MWSHSHWASDRYAPGRLRTGQAERWPSQFYPRSMPWWDWHPSTIARRTSERLYRRSMQTIKRWKRCRSNRAPHASQSASIGSPNQATDKRRKRASSSGNNERDFVGSSRPFNRNVQLLSRRGALELLSTERSSTFRTSLGILVPLTSWSCSAMARASAHLMELLCHGFGSHPRHVSACQFLSVSTGRAFSTSAMDIHPVRGTVVGHLVQERRHAAPFSTDTGAQSPIYLQLLKRP